MAEILSILFTLPLPRIKNVLFMIRVGRFSYVRQWNKMWLNKSQMVCNRQSR